MEKFIDNLPPMDLMRSKKMSFVQLIIPAESAHRAISYLGQLGLLQFRDVKRCAEMSRKLRFFKDQINKAGLIYPSRPVLQPDIDLEDLEIQLAEHEHELIEMNSSMMKRGYKSKPWNGAQNCRIPVLVMSLTLMLMLVILYLSFQTYGREKYKKTKNDSEKPSLDHELPNPKQKWNSFDSLVQLHPKKEFRNGTDLIWQVPESPKGVLFVAHGCFGRAINFWDQSPECPNCIGLPEERLLVLHGLAQGFAVITISSARKCWTYGKEVLVVKDIMEWWISKRKLEKLPLMALGASSGGYFVSVLATTMKFNSIVIMIAEGMFEEMDIQRDYPPTLFVHMPKDFKRHQKIDEYVEILKDKGIDVGIVECMEFPLSPNTLTDRIPGLDQNLSRRLFEFFKEKGFIDQNGYMRRDGRAIKWKKALEEKKTLLLDKRLVPHIQEVLNLAFAYHEMTSVHSDQIYKWFESHMS